MISRKNLFITFFCAFVLIANSSFVTAQNKQKSTEKSKEQTFIFKGDDGKVIELKGDHNWVGDQNHNQFSFDTHFPGGLMLSQDGRHTVEFISHEFSFDSKVVKGAPYTADAITESIQTLSDGNRIVKRSSSKISRDGEGRTRQEQELHTIGNLAAAVDSPRMVYINDPIAGVHYSLNPKDRTARKMTVNKFVTDDGKNVSFKRTSREPGTFDVTVTTTSGPEDLKFVTEDNKTVIITKQNEDVTVIDKKKVAEMEKKIHEAHLRSAETGSSFYFRSSDDVNLDRVKRESLGKQSFEGVEAEGTRTTITIPAGEIGNELPLNTIYERWYSPELQVVVMSRRSDPRSGETTYRLMNINRSEPDPRMFQVPSDYTVNEMRDIKIRMQETEKKLKEEMKRRKQQ